MCLSKAFHFLKAFHDVEKSKKRRDSLHAMPLIRRSLVAISIGLGSFRELTINTGLKTSTVDAMRQMASVRKRRGLGEASIRSYHMARMLQPEKVKFRGLERRLFSLKSYDHSLSSSSLVVSSLLFAGVFTAILWNVKGRGNPSYFLVVARAPNEGPTEKKKPLQLAQAIAGPKVDRSAVCSIDLSIVSLSLSLRSKN